MFVLSRIRLSPISIYQAHVLDVKTEKRGNGEIRLTKLINGRMVMGHADQGAIAVVIAVDLFFGN